MQPVITIRNIGIDWLRGLAVLVMVECHSLVLLRADPAFEPRKIWLGGINGLAAPTFILLAGFVLALVLGKAPPDPAARRQRHLRSLHRIGQVLLIDLLFRFLQMPMLHVESWLKVDILGCIAFSLLGVWVACVWCAARPGTAAAVLLLLAATLFAVTPPADLVRNWGVIGYFLNDKYRLAWSDQGTSMFPLLPWSAYAFLGAGMQRLGSLSRHHRGAAVAVFALLACVGTGVAHSDRILKSVYGDRGYTLTNAGERLQMIGAAGALVQLAAMLWQRHAGSPVLVPLRPAVWTMEFFGRRSLAAFVIHLVVLYGALGLHPLSALHARCGWGAFAAVTAGVVVATGLACHALDRASGAFRPARMPAPVPAVTLSALPAAGRAVDLSAPPA